MTYEEIATMVKGMTDEEFTLLVYETNERISDFRDEMDLCKAAMSVVAATIEGPASGAYTELDDCLECLVEALGRE